MLNFKQREDILPSTLILLSLIILTVTVVYMLAVPVPTVAGTGLMHAQARHRINLQIDFAKKQQAEAESAIKARVWQGNANTANAGVLSLLTAQTSRSAMTLSAFRPQKPVDLTGITELPYTAQITGTYPAIRTVLAALDADSTKIVLRSVQIDSSEQTTSTVTATIGISAYINSSEAPPSTEGATSGAANG
jgi:Tfp pilus assembly protein PilO